MTDTWNGRPPAPLDTVDGPHWVKHADGGTRVRVWMGPDLKFWARSGSDMCFAPFEAASKGFSYVGPVLTPDQIAAKVAEARVEGSKEEREIIAQEADLRAAGYQKINNENCVASLEWFAAAIRARGEAA